MRIQVHHLQSYNRNCTSKLSIKLIEEKYRQGKNFSGSAKRAVEHKTILSDDDMEKLTYFLSDLISIIKYILLILDFFASIFNSSNSIIMQQKNKSTQSRAESSREIKGTSLQKVKIV